MKNRKPKILHVLKSSVYSGAEHVVFTIIKCLRDQFDLIYIASEGPIRKSLEQEGLPFELLSRFDRKHLKTVIKRQKPDIIHAHDFSATVLCASIEGDFRLLSHLHYDPPWVTRWNAKTMVYACCRRRIEMVLMVSEQMPSRMVFAKHYRDKIQIMENPIDKERIKKLSEQLPNGDAKEDLSCDLLFVGRFVEQKNPQRFIYLIERLKRDGWNSIKAKMLGDGPLLQECQELTKCLKLQEQLEIKGFEKNPYPYIRQAGALCVTSRWEGFGLVVAEASLLSVPVLSTNTSGCLGILGVGAEEICQTDDEFLNKIKLLRDHHEVYGVWKERAFTRAGEFADVNKYKTILSEIYKNEDLRRCF